MVTHSSLSRVLQHIAEANWPADMVAMTGDLIQDDSRAAYDRFCDLMSPLELPVYCVPGNHDIRELMRDAVSQERDAVSQEPFHYCASVHIKNWLITCIDSCIDGDASGRVDDDEMDRLAKDLAQTTAEHVLICGSKWLDQVGLKNGDEFLRMIAQPGNVRAAIFGHVHQEFEGTHESIKIIGTPSTCRQFKVASDDFALDNNPPAYRRINLHADGSVENELIWLEPESE
jgi:Icc protein